MTCGCAPFETCPECRGEGKPKRHRKKVQWEVTPEKLTLREDGTWGPVDFNNLFRVTKPRRTAGPRFVDHEGIKITAHFHYNGSGAHAFGGAAKWPVVTLEVGFKEGKASERDEFITALKNFLDEHFKL